jgi:ribonuclease-3
MQDHPGPAGNNQRLEFLGDSVLQLVLTEALFALFPDDREGELTKRRAVLGKGEFLAALAREIGLDACLRLGATRRRRAAATATPRSRTPSRPWSAP